MSQSGWGFEARAAIVLGLALAIAPPAFAHSWDSAYDLPYLEGFDSSSAGTDIVTARLVYLVHRAGTLPGSHGATLLPPGTILDRAGVDESHLLSVWITVPSAGGFDSLSDTRAASIDHVLYAAVADDPASTGIIVRLRIDEDEYKTLGDYVPRPAVIPGPQNAPEVSASSTLREKLMKPEEEAAQAPAPESLGGPVANADGQPGGALSGTIIFINAGHGWTANTEAGTWFLQRPLLLNMCEDYGNIDQLNLLAQYLYNAGAVVVPFRPVGYTPIQIVLDNDDPGVTYTGSWTNSSNLAVYYENHVTNSGVPYRFAAAAAAQSATARYTPTIVTPGFYPVYCWTKDDTDRVRQTYRIHHSGGTAAVQIDHRMIGKGWIWLGTFYLEAGTSNYVEITNQSPDSGVVIADAIRFGIGMGDIVRPGPNTISGYPRDEECARYWAQSELGNNAIGAPSTIYDNTGLSDNDDNVGTAARWAAYMNNTATNNDRWRRLYIEYHTDASGCCAGGANRGVHALITNTGSTTNQTALSTLMGQKMQSDMVAQSSQFEFPWVNTVAPTLTGGYGAISTGNNSNEFDATLLETGFHDNFSDAPLLRSLKVRNAIARSTMQCTIKFLNSLSGSQVPLIYPPEAPDTVRATHDGNGNIVVSWAVPPSGEPLGGPATGYKIYRSTNGYGFGNALDVGNVTTVALSDIAAGSAVYLRVAAYNAGGESMPSETLAVQRAPSGHSQILLVTGFDRVSKEQNPTESIPAGPVDRVIPRRINSFDYCVQHATALTGTGLTFDTSSNEAVKAGAVTLTGYSGVIWILGRESTSDKTFDATEQSLITSYLNSGGRLFASGSEIGFDLDNQGGGVNFYRNTLKSTYVGDDSGTFMAAGSAGCMAGLASFGFDPSGAPYVTASPDSIAPQTGATTILNYVGGTADGAGIQYDSGIYRVVVLGFPFECITSSSVRADVMSRVMNYLLAGTGTVCSTAVLTSFEGYANGTQVMFRPPTFSVTSSNLLGSPNVASVTDEVPAVDGTKSLKVQWHFVDTSLSRWLRLTTASATNVPNPTIDLKRAVRVRIRFEAPAGTSLRVTLGVRETGVNVPIGADGGTSGTIEWLGASSVISGAPQGILVSANPGVWQTLTFAANPTLTQPYSGDGFLSAANNKGVFEHLAFSAVDNAGDFTIYLDGIDQPCPPSVDFDGDGDVDMNDFAHLQACISGSNVPQSNPNCLSSILDGDLDVDSDDVTLFLNCMSGPDIIANPACGL